MLRRILTTAVCLLLALMLPLQAMAATQYSFTVVPGDELGAEKAVADLFNALSIKVVKGDNSGALSLALDNTDVLSLAVRAAQEGFYVQSEAVSGKALFFSWDELMELAVASMESGSSGMDEDEIAKMSASLDAIKRLIGAPKGSLAEQDAVMAQSQTIEEAMPVIKEQFKDDPKMVAVMEDIVKRIKTTDGEFADASRDIATQKTELVITKQDILAICDTQYMKNSLTETVAAEMPKATEEEKAARVEENLALAKEMLQSSEMNLPIVVYTADDGNALVGMEVNMDFKTTDEGGVVSEEPISANLQMAYNRLTTDSGISHKGEMIIEEDGKTEGLITLDYLKGADDNGHGMLAMFVEDQQITFMYDQIKTAGQTDRNLAIYMREDATSIVTPAASDRPIITFVLNTQEVEDSALAAISAATADNALKISAMNAEEQTAFSTELQTRLSQAMMTIFSKLPASVLELAAPLMQQAQ